MPRLTAIILTHDESAHITSCIETLRFADRILVFDSFSEDDTVNLARAAGADVIQHEFKNYAHQRNAALEAVRNETDWVLFVDADERVETDLAEEVLDVVQKSGYAAWRIPRHNYIFEKLTRGAGWYPDYQTRLLNINRAHYDPQRQVHEVVVLDGPEGTLSGHLTHLNYRDVAHFAEKQERYAAYEAQILFQDGIRPKFRNFILQPYREFVRRFIILKGYIDGWHGMRLCLYMAWYEFRKYWLLRQRWNKGQAYPSTKTE